VKSAVDVAISAARDVASGTERAVFARGDGAGCNLNLPLPQGTDWQRWSEALEHATKAIIAYAPAALIVSLGVDTFEGDELSSFRLTTPDFLRMGASIAGLRLPTVS
jgi:acetoin utilization deacetylase AcuC-like enzyme